MIWLTIFALSSVADTSVPLSFARIEATPTRSAEIWDHPDLEVQASTLTPQRMFTNSKGIGSLSVAGVWDRRYVAGISSSALTLREPLSFSGRTGETGAGLLSLKLGLERTEEIRYRLQPYAGIYLRPIYTWNANDRFRLPIEGALGMGRQIADIKVLIGGQVLSSFSGTPDMGAFLAGRWAL